MKKPVTSRDDRKPAIMADVERIYSKLSDYLGLPNDLDHGGCKL